MSGISRGFVLGLAMLIGALVLTLALAVGLQGHALKQQPEAADYSPTMDAIVDPSGWPREDNAHPRPSDAPRVDGGRSRLPAASSESGV
jgi:hypothetical protein